MLHSIVRRTNFVVHARCYCRNFLPKSFSVRNLRVEFIEITEDPGGIYPWWCNSCSFDRLRIIQDHPSDWDRCWIMDYDNLAVTDLAEVYFDDFNGNLVMASSYNTTLGSTCHLPSELSNCSDFEYYMMGPIINLRLMREAGTWQRLLKCHALIRGDDQKAIIAATENRVKVLPKRWQRIVYYDDLDRDYDEMFPNARRSDCNYFEGYGLLHFTAGPKPWWDASVENKPKKKEAVWRKEFATWDLLRSGNWVAPSGPSNSRRCSAVPESIGPAPANLEVQAPLQRMSNKTDSNVEARNVEMDTPCTDVRPLVFVGICSSTKNKSRRDEIRQTWLKVPAPSVKYSFFVGIAEADESTVGEGDVALLDVPDAYEYLPLKIQRFFRTMLCQDFDYLFKCDDDTYVRPDRLHELLDCESDFICSEDWNKYGWAQGGGWIHNVAQVCPSPCWYEGSRCWS